MEIMTERQKLYIKINYGENAQNLSGMAFKQTVIHKQAQLAKHYSGKDSQTIALKIGMVVQSALFANCIKHWNIPEILEVQKFSHPPSLKNDLTRIDTHYVIIGTLSHLSKKADIVREIINGNYIVVQALDTDGNIDPEGEILAFRHARGLLTPRHVKELMPHIYCVQEELITLPE